jgi:hypothetical protein
MMLQKKLDLTLLNKLEEAKAHSNQIGIARHAQTLYRRTVDGLGQIGAEKDQLGSWTRYF